MGWRRLEQVRLPEDAQTPHLQGGHLLIQGNAAGSKGSLVMLNTFMSASDIPQVSEEVALKVQFKFRISKRAERKEFQARIVGFTNEVSAVLVPEAFMNYGNTNFAEDDELKITQVMISGNESEFGLLEELLNKKGLESKKSQVVIARLKSVVGTLIMVVLGISVIAVFVSGLVLIQYLQLKDT